MAVAALCHLCQRPTIQSCRGCGRAACGKHLDRMGVCDACRSGDRGPPMVR